MSDKENVLIKEEVLPGPNETQTKNKRRRRNKKKKAATQPGDDVAKSETRAPRVLSNNNKANVSNGKNKNLSDNKDVNKTEEDSKGNHAGVQDRYNGDDRYQRTADDNRHQRKKGRGRMDRYYGRFGCKVCRKTWESAFVFTRAGTKQVLFKQRCKNCTGDDAWVMPYKLELLRCSICQSDICSCTCEDCGLLKHTRWIPSPDDPETLIEDISFEYCGCDKRGRSYVGDSIDPKKPHLSELCQKCLKGHPCTQRRGSISDDLPLENEQ